MYCFSLETVPYELCLYWDWHQDYKYIFCLKLKKGQQCFCPIWLIAGLFWCFWVVMVKNGHDRTIIPKWMDEAQFLHANTYSGKLKVTFIELLGQHDQIWVWPFGSWDYVICCISRMNEWIELIFCMLIHSIRKAKSYFGYAHCQIWMWPLRAWDS